MKAEIIIDGYNVIYRNADLRACLDEGLEQAREELLHKLISFRANKKIKITVVFDGDRVQQPSSVKQKGIQIYYSIPPRKADEDIKLLLQKSRNPQNITVISSDNEIMGFARSSRAQLMRSEEFYQKYLSFETKYEDTTDTDVNMSETELKKWLDLFENSKK